MTASPPARSGRVSAWTRPTRSRRNAGSYRYIDSLPESLFSTRTQADGTYRIDGLPREAQFLSSINPGPEYEPLSPTIATTTREIRGVRSLGYDAVLDHRFALPREVRLAVRYSDSNLPARDATLRARSHRALLRAGSVGTTDDRGRATLRLRPGDYELAIEPSLGAPYRPGRRSLKIGPEDVAEINDLKLQPAALVTLEAVDAKTGAGIEDVRFQYETEANPRHRDVPSQLVVLDHPATDDRGRLRAVVEPGRQRFFVEAAPQGWKFEGQPGEWLDLAAGRETTVRFAFAKLEDPATNGPSTGVSSIFPEDLVEKWRRQQRAARTGKFRIRHASIGSRGAISPAELVAFLNRGDLGDSRDIVATILAAFPGLADPQMTSHEIVLDARRRRETVRRKRLSEVNTYIFNGNEFLGYSNLSADVHISIVNNFGSGIWGIPDVGYWPRFGHPPARSSASPGRDPAIRLTEGTDGRLTIENETENGTAKWLVDRETGFVHAYSSIPRPRQSVVERQEVRQYGPKVFPNGAVLPTVRVEARLSGDQDDYLTIQVIDDADLSYRPGPLDFALAVPAGTLIVDIREGQASPNKGIAHYPVADVVAYADEMALRYRSIEPVLTIGQPAPPIRPAAWFDRNGPAVAPDLAGKVTLVDFWGYTSGPCMAELPEVQAAADRFAARSKDFILIGLHNSGPTVGEAAMFARKQGLTYRLAIDHPTDEDGWPGATFQSYGIHSHAVPAAAVIDRRGKVAFVGPFRQALQKAADLLGP